MKLFFLVTAISSLACSNAFAEYNQQNQSSLTEKSSFSEENFSNFGSGDVVLCGVKLASVSWAQYYICAPLVAAIPLSCASGIAAPACAGEIGLAAVACPFSAAALWGAVAECFN